MIRNKAVARSLAPIYDAPTYQPVPQMRPAQIDVNYFDKLAAFGLACLAAAMVGKWVMTSLHKRGLA